MFIIDFAETRSIERTVKQNQERQKQSRDKCAKGLPEFDVSDRVYVRNYAPGPGWLAGRIMMKAGNESY